MNFQFEPHTMSVEEILIRADEFMQKQVPIPATPKRIPLNTEAEGFWPAKPCSMKQALVGF